MKNFRKIGVFVQVLLLASALVSCGGGGNEGNSQPAVNDPVSGSNDNQDSEIGGLDSIIGIDTPDTSVDQETAGPTAGDSQVDSNNDSDGMHVDLVDTETPATVPELLFLSDLTETSFFPLVSVNRFGHLAVAGSEYTSGNFDPGRRLLVGNLSGLSVVLTEGESIPGVPRTQRVGNFEQISMADDGSVAALVALKGSSDEQAAVVYDTAGLRLVARTNAALTTLNTSSFELESISSVSKVGNAVLLSASVADRHNVIILDDGIGLTVLAESSRDPVLLLGDNMPALFDANCRIVLNGISHLADDGSVLYGSDFDFRCPHDSGLVRYRDGRHSSLVSEGESVPGVPESVFGKPDLIRIAPDGTSVVEVSVTRSSGPSVNSLWQFNPDDMAQLLVIQGETVESPEGQQVLTDREVDFRTFDWHPNGHYALSIRADDEQYVFAGEARQSLPYTNFDSVGASSAEFVLSTLSLVPAPFPASSFFDDLSAINVISDGR